MNDHRSDIRLLAALGLGVIILIAIALLSGSSDKLDVAAFLLVLNNIVGAVKERWMQRSVDRMGDNLAQSAPPANDNQATGKPGDPVHTVEEAA